jgi:hypothetical protein
MGEKRNVYSFRCENLKEGENLEDLYISKRVIRNWFLKKVVSGCGPEPSGWEWGKLWAVVTRLMKFRIP